MLLDALRALPLPPPPPPAAPAVDAPSSLPERFAWRLSAPFPGHVEVDAVELLPGARHWRAGERIPLRALPRPGEAGWERLGPRERQAFAALEARSRKPKERGLPLALLAALEGHGHLLWAQSSGDAGRPVALARELCALVVREERDGWILGLSPHPDKAPGLLRLEGDELRLTGFTALHQRLEALLGRGARVPAAHREGLAAWLGRLWPHLPLLTDLEPSPVPPAEAPEGRLRVWLKGSLERLDLELGLLPGPHLAPCPPGEGPRWVVAGPKGGRHLRRRDLAFESGRAEQVRALIPPEARPLGPLAWRLEGTAACGAFLAGLRDLGPRRVQLAGVPGLLPPLPRPPAEGELALEVRALREGFEVKGSLAGRPLARLLPALRGCGRFLALEGGEVLDLQGLLGRQLRSLAAWSTESGGALRLSRAAGAVLAELGGGGDRPGRAFTPPLEAQVPAGFQGSLRPYQLEGFRWMARLLDQGLGACLADDMGLGKTVQTAALLLHRAPQGPSLVLAPTSVAPNWQTELSRFAPELALRDLDAGLEGLGPGRVMLASYGQLLGRGEALLDLAWGTVVLDEAHAIKNPATRRAQASARLRARGRLALTGTPVENHPGELQSLLGWLLPELGERLERARDLEELRDLAAPFLLRRLKGQVLKELPPLTELTVQVEPGEAEAAFHRELLARCREEVADGTTLHLLAALMKLRRACAHPSLADPAYAGPGAKIELLMDRLSVLREEGHRALVFSQFTDLLDLVQRRLEEAGIPHRRLDGSTPARARTREVAAFQAGEGEVFLISLRAGGQGLNLTEADDVFHLDPWWNPAVEDQATARAHRMGRQRPVTVHRMVMKDSVEARVLALHGSKRALVEGLLEGREEAAGLDRETLERLLGG